MVGRSYLGLLTPPKARKRELAIFDESRRAVGILKCLRDKKERTHLGGRMDDTCFHGLSRSWKINLKYRKKQTNWWARRDFVVIC